MKQSLITIVVRNWMVQRNGPRRSVTDELKLGQRTALSKKNINDFSKGNVFIENKLDLHGFNLVEAKNLLENFINQSVKNNKRLILVITGKGKEGEGIIKNKTTNERRYQRERERERVTFP